MKSLGNFNFILLTILAVLLMPFGARTSKTKAAPQKPKPSIKNILTKLTPLALIANLAAALVALGLDIPIVDVSQDGDDLVITLYGGRIERFPLDYNLVIKIDKLDSHKPEDAATRLALSALGKDKNSPADWVEKLSL